MEIVDSVMPRRKHKQVENGPVPLDELIRFTPHPDRSQIFPVKVYDPQNKLKKVISTKELNARTDQGVQFNEPTGNP